MGTGAFACQVHEPLLLGLAPGEPVVPQQHQVTRCFAGNQPLDQLGALIAQRDVPGLAAFPDPHRDRADVAILVGGLEPTGRVLHQRESMRGMALKPPKRRLMRLPNAMAGFSTAR